MKAIYLLVAMLAYTSLSTAQGRCRYYCPAQHGGYRCCDAQDPGTVSGSCPTGIFACTRPPFHQQPRPCTSDTECGFNHKCCLDTCLHYRTCKPTNLVIDPPFSVTPRPPVTPRPTDPPAPDDGPDLTDFIRFGNN